MNSRMTGGKENREQMELMQNLLQIGEELKVIIPKITNCPNEVTQLVKAQAVATNKLAKLLLVMKKGLEERLKVLDACEEETREKTDDHEARILAMEKRIKKLEFIEIRDIMDKLGKRNKITIEDLKTLDGKLKEYPDEQELYFLKGRVLRSLKKTDELNTFVETVVKEHRKSPFVWYMRAYFTLNPNQKAIYYKRSLRLLEGEKADEELKHTVLHELANVFHRIGKQKLALKTVNQALEAYSDCAGAWGLKGKILAKLKRIPEAIGCIDTGLKLDESSVYLWILKAEALADLGLEHSIDVIASYDKAIKADPQDPWGYVEKAKFLNRIDKFEDSLGILEEAIKIDENDPCTWYYKGATLVLMKKYPEAIEVLKKTLVVSGEPIGCAMALRVLLLLHYAKGPVNEFQRIYEQCRENSRFWNTVKENDRADFSNSYAWNQFKSGTNLEKALEAALEATKIKPKNIYFLDTLGCVLQALGKDREALEVFERALKFHKNDKQISWETLSSLYTRLGKTKEATEALRKIRKDEK